MYRTSVSPGTVQQIMPYFPTITESSDIAFERTPQKTVFLLLRSSYPAIAYQRSRHGLTENKSYES
jgi:hypothetical protein